MASSVAGPSRGQSFKGSGLAILRSHPGPGNSLACTFTHLHFTFPLKLIHPRTSGRDAGLLLAKADQQRQGRENEGAIGTAAGDGASSPKAIAVLYIVGYGGGLVSGDDVELDVDVGEQCTLLLLTQGSTKVFKMRTAASHSSATGGPSTKSSSSIRNSTPAHGSSRAFDEPVSLPITRQYTRFSIRPRSTLLLLPDPVTCYASSRYTQAQRFDVKCRRSSSLILLDWLTPGRQHLAQSSGDSTGGSQSEAWRFQSYRSRNEVRVEGQVVIRDVLLLEQGAEQCLAPSECMDAPGAAPRTKMTELGRRNHPYSCYANLFLLGPDAQPLIAHLNDEFNAIQQRVLPSTHRGGPGGSGGTFKSINGGVASSRLGGNDSVQSLIWSMSILNDEGSNRDQAQYPPPASATNTKHQQAVIRIAGRDTEGVRTWLRQRLKPLENVVGPDLYKQAIW